MITLVLSLLAEVVLLEANTNNNVEWSHYCMKVKGCHKLNTQCINSNASHLVLIGQQ